MASELYFEKETTKYKAGSNINWLLHTLVCSQNTDSSSIGESGFLKSQIK